LKTLADLQKRKQEEVSRYHSIVEDAIEFLESKKFNQKQKQKHIKLKDDKWVLRQCKKKKYEASPVCQAFQQYSRNPCIFSRDL
jgi:hypothetical protein